MTIVTRRVREEPPDRNRVQRRHDELFWQYHDDNPWVLEQLLKDMRQDYADGLPRTSVKLYVGHLRFLDRRRTKTNDFKLNDRDTSRYARLIVYLHPELRSMLEFRTGPSVTGFDPSRGGLL